MRSAKTSGLLRSPNQPIELVLGGGGIKGFAHIGLLKAIEERKINIGDITGVSIGSAVAAFYTNGYTPDEIADIFLTEVRHISPHSPEKTVSARSLLHGGMDIKQLCSNIVSNYSLRPQRKLHILTYNVLRAEPVMFEGTKYDLPTAIAASCAVPVVMRPVWYGQKKAGKLGTIVRSWRGKTDEGVLVDGGVHHPHPAHFCKGPAIISKLGTATQLPSEWPSALELVFHLLEMTASRLVDWYFPDPQNHVLIRVGKPDVGCLTFGLSADKCRELIDYAYGVACEKLDAAIEAGKIAVDNR